ncbi:hypothetical protein VSH64_00175 [Amycolatopsis rhabdoformis]|uniref:Uncharacterized protein n=1 Tax=Amycolatopsis rhabdoformis TaxID=1448059 RepID=A0ABZ1I873_9PSEU|nr:hypothetical protein [Amycolatopsis rhabdoformis]WSE30567.1 hypothetical protein VSH64_00175 [Amycolatopsis rhabdoformis]
MKILRKALLTTAVAAAALSFATAPANAAPLSSAPYGSYAHEGEFPSSGPCPHGSFSSVRRVFTSVIGSDGTSHPMQIDLMYFGGCGAEAEVRDTLTNSGTDNCTVFVDRSDDGGATWVNEQERVTYGSGETRIANNLNGRLARAALACGSSLTRTGWF